MRKNTFVGLMVVIGLSFVLLLSQTTALFDFGRGDVNTATLSEKLDFTAGSLEAFNYLSQQRSNFCGLQPDAVLAYADDVHIQGSCCTPIDFHRYQEQVEELETYTSITQIPVDPYDIPASLAKELLGYQTSIQLTSAQQSIYDQAVETSEEGGPCCCQCWRWHAFEGMGKYLITQLEWTAEELGALWSLTDGCGGAGHQHG